MVEKNKLKYFSKNVDNFLDKCFLMCYNRHTIRVPTLSKILNKVNITHARKWTALRKYCMGFIFFGRCVMKTFIIRVSEIKDETGEAM